ncbi:MAG: polysaccharide deacetylase family protein [Oscillospiraceae bacterium]
MKKRLLILAFLVLMLCGLFSSCKSDDEEDESSNSSKSSSQSSSSGSLPSTNSQTDTTSESKNQSSSNESLESKPTQITVNATPISANDVDKNKLLALENEPKGWGQGVIVDKNNRPTSCDVYQKKYGEYGAVFIKEQENKNVYLTFDEGYENGYTAKILDTLKEKDCHAVFFVTMDYVKKQEKLVKRMIDEGHVVGNHSATHPSMPKVSQEKAIDEIVTLHNYICEKFNYNMTLFRPPMGEWSTRTLEIAKQLGYKTVFWSFAYKDWETDKQMGIEKAYPKVSKAVHNGAVYLLHAVSKDNTEMLGKLIDEMRNKGFSLDKLT